jgi:hypothetical protein
MQTEARHDGARRPLVLLRERLDQSGGCFITFILIRRVQLGEIEWRFFRTRISSAGWYRG